MSRWYGPGRYDRDHEERGRDLPPSYVRWTEHRNMQAFLALVAEGRRPAELTTHRFTVDDAPHAYAVLTGQKAGPARSASCSTTKRPDLRWLRPSERRPQRRRHRECSDSFSAHMRFAGGLGTHVYSGGGDTRLSKELIEAFGAVAAVLDDSAPLSSTEPASAGHGSPAQDNGRRA